MIVPLVVWSAATALHFVLTVRATRRVLPPGASSLDEQIFVSVLGGVASLAIILHAAAVTVGLGMGSGIGGLAVWHVALWGIARSGVPEEPPVAGSRDRATPLEVLAIVVFGGIVLTWGGLAAESSSIGGPDAAHYHVPVAVNLAAGASLFDLPATPHLYPMAGSMVAAWFIVPLGDPLIVDLAMVLPCVLLVVSLNLLFRCATGLSGTAWASWLALALLSTPMFRASSQGSADLWFASAFVSSLAVIILAWSRGRWSGLTVVLAGSALGLLVGTKATGAPAAVLIAGTVVWIAGLRRLSGSTPVARPRRLGLVAVAAALACIGTGGVWLIRNWAQFGSPIAPSGFSIGGIPIFAGEPFQRTTYLSVLAEMDTNAFHLWPRTQFFVRQWLGSWYLIALWPIAVLVLDLAVRARSRAADHRWWPRLALLILTVVVGVVLIWLLIGAPWTGLERSRGLTLRYVLPIAALLPLLAFVGCFPLGVAWHERPVVRRVAAAAIVFGSGVPFWMSLQPPTSQAASAIPVPGLGWPWLAVSVMIVTLVRATSRRSPALSRMVALLSLVAVLAWWAPATARQDAIVRAQGQSGLDEEELAFAAGRKPADAWREPFLAVRAAEHAEGLVCRNQRFFALTRFDEPLALQPPGFGNEVYYAGRDVAAARRAGPVAACDYVVTTPALAATEKGQALADALAGERGLRLFASTRDLIILTPVTK